MYLDMYLGNLDMYLGKYVDSSVHKYHIPEDVYHPVGTSVRMCNVMAVTIPEQVISRHRG